MKKKTRISLLLGNASLLSYEYARFFIYFTLLCLLNKFTPTSPFPFFVFVSRVPVFSLSSFSP